MEKGWRSSRWAAAHPSSLGHWKKKKKGGEEKYKSAKAGKLHEREATYKKAYMNGLELATLAPTLPPFKRPHIASRSALRSVGTFPPRGERDLFGKRKKKLQALYIIYDIIHVFLTLESTKKPSILQNFGAKNLSFLPKIYFLLT